MFPERLDKFATEFDRWFDAYLKPGEDVPPKLLEAMRYSALAPGKRLRPFLAVRSCEVAGGKERTEARPVAAAVECVHAFSLIHDDLPAMDNAQLRRGQPACHKRFGEATAILAGDALVVLAFELLTRDIEDGVIAKRLVSQLAAATGWTGMIGGEAADVYGETEQPDLKLADYIHERKTARLFEAACRMGAIVGGGKAETVDSLGRFGQMVGRAFQIVDDLLDVTSSAERLGKAVGKDAPAGKQTFHRCVGIERSRDKARKMAVAAVEALNGFGPQADDLRALAEYVVHDIIENRETDKKPPCRVN